MHYSAPCRDWVKHPGFEKLLFCLVSLQVSGPTAECKFSILLINMIHLNMLYGCSWCLFSLLVCNSVWNNWRDHQLILPPTVIVLRRLVPVSYSWWSSSFDLKQKFGMLRRKRRRAYFRLANRNAEKQGNLWEHDCEAESGIPDQISTKENCWWLKYLSEKGRQWLFWSIKKE